MEAQVVQGEKRKNSNGKEDLNGLSMDGLFLENGPYRVNPDLSVNISSGGWQDHATIVYCEYWDDESMRAKYLWRRC